MGLLFIKRIVSHYVAQIYYQQRLHDFAIQKWDSVFLKEQDPITKPKLKWCTLVVCSMAHIYNRLRVHVIYKFRSGIMIFKIEQCPLTLIVNNFSSVIRKSTRVNCYATH